jgi:hypothetical protein
MLYSPRNYLQDAKSIGVQDKVREESHVGMMQTAGFFAAYTYNSKPSRKKYLILDFAPIINNL